MLKEMIPITIEGDKEKVKLTLVTTKRMTEKTKPNNMSQQECTSITDIKNATTLARIQGKSGSK